MQPSPGLLRPNSSHWRGLQHSEPVAAASIAMRRISAGPLTLLEGGARQRRIDRRQQRALRIGVSSDTAAADQRHRAKDEEQVGAHMHYRAAGRQQESSETVIWMAWPLCSSGHVHADFRGIQQVSSASAVPSLER